MELEFSKYPTPGVYQEESNNSVISQVAQEATINFVPGFSRKGVFNRPVLVSSPADRELLFGALDRTLEAKGSFFHRTIDTMLQTGPVWALNLLTTTKDDLLAFRSVSLSPAFDNSEEVLMPFENVFNRSGFWTRSTDLFTFNAKESNTDLNAVDKVLHLTNIGDKKITVFMTKSKLQGFDVTAEAWYGAKDKVPSYINPLSLISDFSVRVSVVAGDYTDYRALANDARWSKFFNTTGLRKGALDAFVSDRQVTRLLDKECSLIPYFKDRNGNNLFIESVINLYTDRTGLFCAFDTDKFETSVPKNYIDLVGNSLVNSERAGVSFMSYKDTILETDSFTEVKADRAGNIVGIGTNGTFTAAKTFGAVSDLMYISATGSNYTYNAASGATAVLGGSLVALTAGTNSVAYTAPATPVTGYNYRVDVTYLDATGALKVLFGTVLPHATDYSSVATFLAAHPTLAPSAYPNSAIVLGVFLQQVATVSGALETMFDHIAVNGSGFNALSIGTGSEDIFVNTNVANNVLSLVFSGTGAVTKANYKAWRAKQTFDAIVAGKDLARTAIVDNTGAKVTFNSTVSWVDNSASSTGERSLTITVAEGINIQTASATGGKLHLYFVDDEFSVGRQGVHQHPSNTNAAVNGKLGKYSVFAQSFVNGGIKTGDFFYPLLKSGATAAFSKVGGNSVVTFTNMSMEAATALNDEGYIMWLSGHSVNNGKYTVMSVNSSTSSAIEVVVSEDVTASAAETINVHSFMDKTYLKLYTVNDVIHCEFCEQGPGSIAPLNPAFFSANTSLNVYSDEQAYEQTLEIEQPVGYEVFETKILVDSARYPEVAVGNFLRAYVDYSLLNVVEQEEPRRMTRIISKKPWAGNIAGGVRYSEIITDAKIHRDVFGGDHQTTRYTTVEDYVDTYKGIVLGGFQVHVTSIPDGTEERQTKILNVMATGTSMFEAICNKNRFNFRYLVDSFGKGLTEFSKHQIADICGKRKNALGFISAPSVKDFRKSASPSFIDEDGALVAEYIAIGGNPNNNPAFNYTLATGPGAACVGYFAPYATVNENGRPLSVPMAPYAATAYMRKNNSRTSGVNPWTIVAGPNEGRIIGIGNVEYDFTDGDIKWLNQVGINPVVYKKNKGYCLETENTAEQQPKSSLSFLHSREVLIELENELYAMLLNYQWKFNLAPIRAEIKRKADDICDRFVERNALYRYRNVCDETNNTPIVIDNQFGLLETYVEIVKGMGVIVNYINVQATGTIDGGSLASSGFGA